MKPSREIPIKDMKLERHGDHLVFRISLMDGGVLTLPISNETARDLGKALLENTSIVIQPGMH